MISTSGRTTRSVRRHCGRADEASPAESGVVTDPDRSMILTTRRHPVRRHSYPKVAQLCHSLGTGSTRSVQGPCAASHRSATDRQRIRLPPHWSGPRTHCRRSPTAPIWGMARRPGRQGREHDVPTTPHTPRMRPGTSPCLSIPDALASPTVGRVVVATNPIKRLECDCWLGWAASARRRISRVYPWGDSRRGRMSPVTRNSPHHEAMSAQSRGQRGEYRNGSSAGAEPLDPHVRARATELHQQLAGELREGG